MDIYPSSKIIALKIKKPLEIKRLFDTEAGGVEPHPV
jgi:hypothetical protein